MAKLIHAMLRVLDLERSLEFYQRTLGLVESRRLDFPGFTLAYLRNPENDFEIELTLNKGRSEPYTHGDAYGHIAVCVDSLLDEHARLKGKGYVLGDIKELKREDKLIGRFFFVTDPDGYRIEVLERYGDYK